MGNRLSSLGVASYSYNPSNELTMTSNGTFGYDYNGNLTSKTNSSGTTNYTWDFENRLTQVTLPNSGGTVTFEYDPFGRRIQKVYTTGATPPMTATTNYLYDGDNVVEMVDQNGNLLSRVAQGQNIDEPLALSASGTTDFYEQDGLGTVTSLTNGSGAIAQSYTFDSYGNTTNSSGNVANPFRYTGRDFDSETGLYYYRARYYDATTGRFASEDPIGFLGGVHFYTYVSNRSENLIDPKGEAQVCCRSAHLGAFGFTAGLIAGGQPCHCFIRLSGDQGTLGGYFSWSADSFGDLVRNPSDPTDASKYKKEAKCNDLPGVCEARLTKAFGSLPPDLGPYGPQPGGAGTSNAVTLAVLNNAGVKWTPPPCAWGAVPSRLPSPPIGPWPYNDIFP